MKGDPEDPLPILRAVNELACHWEELDGEGDSLDGPDITPGSPVWDMSEAQLKRHYGSWAEASEGVFRVAVLSLKIRVWVAAGPDWRRPTIHTIRELLPPKSGLYIDQEEVRRVFGSRWPKSFSLRPSRLPLPTDLAVEAPPVGTKREASLTPVKGKPGPKKGPGYSRKDVPVFDMILSAQRESGDVETQYALVRKFAPKDAHYNSHVERLRKGLPIWLGQNGHEWEPSK
jgi:hypothetical protein